jgi:hypothetical protein
MSDHDLIRRGDALKVLRWEYSRQDRADITAIPAADPMADPRVKALVEALRAVEQHEVSIFWGPDAEKNERASWRGVMRKVKAALAYVDGEKT